MDNVVAPRGSGGLGHRGEAKAAVLHHHGFDKKEPPQGLLLRDPLATHDGPPGDTCRFIIHRGVACYPDESAHRRRHVAIG